MSIATGSTSRTPYIVCTSSGQNAPNAARKTSLFSVRPEREEEQRDQRGRGDRPQELDRDAERASPRGRSSRGGSRSERRARSRRPSPSAQPRTVWPNASQKSLRLHQRPELAEASCSSPAGPSPRSSPSARSTSQNTSAAVIESTKMRRLDEAAGPSSRDASIPRCRDTGGDFPARRHGPMYTTSIFRVGPPTASEDD